MKRFIFVLSLVLLCLEAGAQRFTCDFKVEEADSGTFVIAGKAYVQEQCYKFETKDGALYCDGKSRWIYSSTTQELVIQNNDLPVLKDVDLKNISGPSYTAEYSRYKIYLTSIMQVEEPWSATFFIIDPALIDGETIITDLR